MKTTCSSQPSTSYRVNNQDINDHIHEIDEFTLDNHQNPLPQIKSIYHRDEVSSRLPQQNEHLKNPSNLSTQSISQNRKLAQNHYNLKYLFALPCLLLILSMCFYPIETTYHKSSTTTNPNDSRLSSNTSSSPLASTIENLNLHENVKKSQEIFNGSICEQIYLVILSTLNTTPLKQAIEFLDSHEDEVEKGCPTSLEDVNPDVFYKMVEIYSFHIMDVKYLKWLSKIQEIVPSDPINSPFLSTFIKMYISLAGWYTGVGNYKLSRSNLEEAQRLLKNYPTENSKEHIDLQSWFVENLGKYYFARYRKSQDAGEKEDLYKKIEEAYHNAIEENLSRNQLLYAGLAQCHLAEFYIRTKEYEKAEEINRKGKQNLQSFDDQGGSHLTSNQKCLRNDALIDIGRGQYEAAKIKYEEAMSQLNKSLPQRNDIINIYREEYLAFFPNSTFFS